MVSRLMSSSPDTSVTRWERNSSPFTEVHKTNENAAPTALKSNFSCTVFSQILWFLLSETLTRFRLTPSSPPIGFCYRMSRKLSVLAAYWKWRHKPFPLSRKSHKRVYFDLRTVRDFSITTQPIFNGFEVLETDSHYPRYSLASTED